MKVNFKHSSSKGNRRGKEKQFLMIFRVLLRSRWSPSTMSISIWLMVISHEELGLAQSWKFLKRKL
uniref:Uncharacterized protein n=1 Tax=Utricularia reniformis TaxID=192314 RepID=A0A1Y0B4P0_9LAMI|nr:hypothetical protein AEK19_MT2280 [Utricularia reniformis]ART32425.1 hypothetical protein AEK19_MT2280 [Utricularia reniformis]